MNILFLILLLFTLVTPVYGLELEPPYCPDPIDVPPDGFRGGGSSGSNPQCWICWTEMKHGADFGWTDGYFWYKCPKCGYANKYKLANWNLP